MQEYLTPEDIAKRYQVTPHAVREWCRTGKLKAIQLGKLGALLPLISNIYSEQHRGGKREAKKS